MNVLGWCPGIVWQCWTSTRNLNLYVWKISIQPHEQFSSECQMHCCRHGSHLVGFCQACWLRRQRQGDFGFYRSVTGSTESNTGVGWLRKEKNVSFCPSLLFDVLWILKVQSKCHFVKCLLTPQEQVNYPCSATLAFCIFLYDTLYHIVLGLLCISLPPRKLKTLQRKNSILFIYLHIDNNMRHKEGFQRTFAKWMQVVLQCLEKCQAIGRHLMSTWLIVRNRNK